MDSHRAVDAPHDRGLLDRVIAIVHSPKVPSDGWEDSWKKSTIVVRSNRDHGAIEPRSLLLHRGINTTILPIPGAQFPLKTASEKSSIEARSPRDRGLIAA